MKKTFLTLAAIGALTSSANATNSEALRETEWVEHKTEEATRKTNSKQELIKTLENEWIVTDVNFEGLDFKIEVTLRPCEKIYKIPNSDEKVFDMKTCRITPSEEAREKLIKVYESQEVVSKLLNKIPNYIIEYFNDPDIESQKKMASWWDNETRLWHKFFDVCDEILYEYKSKVESEERYKERSQLESKIDELKTDRDLLTGGFLFNGIIILIRLLKKLNRRTEATNEIIGDDNYLDLLKAINSDVDSGKIDIKLLQSIMKEADKIVDHFNRVYDILNKTTSDNVILSHLNSEWTSIESRENELTEILKRCKDVMKELENQGETPALDLIKIKRCISKIKNSMSLIHKKFSGWSISENHLEKFYETIVLPKINK